MGKNLRIIPYPAGSNITDGIVKSTLFAFNWYLLKLHLNYWYFFLTSSQFLSISSGFAKSVKFVFYIYKDTFEVNAPEIYAWAPSLSIETSLRVLSDNPYNIV